jgi:Ca2+/H+ antiporter, TMEM165/GDT1 family
MITTPTFLTAFTAGLTLITAAELGDKTFFISLCLAMRYPRRWVFLGSMAALIAMTVISVVMGQVLSLLPAQVTRIGVIGLFIFFGIKLLFDAYKMSPTKGITCESEAEQAAIATVSDVNLSQASIFGILSKTAVMTFLAEWGDRTQIATASLAAKYDAIGVTLGAIIGHAICALIAVVGGKFIAGRLSERLVTAMGGILFLIFAIVTAMEKL